MFGFGKKDKEVEKGITMPLPPIVVGGENFYPLSTNNEADSEALILMYNELPEIQIPVNYIIDSLSVIPIHHATVLSDGTYLRTKNNYINDVINKPNQWATTSTAFIKDYLLNRLLLGAGYINTIKPGGQVSQMYVLPSKNTQGVIESNKVDVRLANIDFYYTNFGNGRIKLKGDEVVSDYESSFIIPTENTYIQAYSRLMSAVLASKSLKYNYEAKVKLYQDRGALGLIFPKDSNAILDKTASDKLKTAYQTNAGIIGTKSPFLTGSVPLEYVPITFNAADLQLQENRIQDFNMLCALYGIDPVIFGLTPSTFANKEWATINMWENKLKPIMKAYLQVLSRAFELPDNELFIPDYSGVAVLAKANLSKVDAYSKMLSDGVITVEQYQAALNIV